MFQKFPASVGTATPWRPASTRTTCRRSAAACWRRALRVANPDGHSRRIQGGVHGPERWLAETCRASRASGDAAEAARRRPVWHFRRPVHPRPRRSSFRPRPCGRRHFSQCFLGLAPRCKGVLAFSSGLCFRARAPASFSNFNARAASLFRVRCRVRVGFFS